MVKSIYYQVNVNSLASLLSVTQVVYRISKSGVLHIWKGRKIAPILSRHPSACFAILSGCERAPYT